MSLLLGVSGEMAQNLVIAVVLFRIMPETSGRSLEEIERDMEARYS